MPAALLFVIFVVLLVIAIPVSITLGIASVLPSVFDPSFTVGAKYLIRAMFGGLDSFPLLAVPMFVLSGIIMAKGGISKKLFDVFAFFLGNFTAGMPCAVIVTCLFYGAISGSAPATVAAVGSMTIPILSALGYDRTFSTAIVAVAGETGYLGLQGNMEEELRQGSDVITNAAVPGKAQLLVFATPKVYGSYQGFEYDCL